MARERERETEARRPKRGMMGGDREPWEGGNDAAGMEPKLIPDYELQGRDDSGGPDYDGYSASFGDGGFVQGEKAHLSVRGGKDDPEESDEQSERSRAKVANRDTGEAPDADVDAPAKSKKMQRE